MTTPHHAGSVVLKEDLVTRLAFLTGTYEVEDEGGYVAADENGNFGGGIPDRKLNLLGFVLHHAAVGFNFGIMSGAAYPVMQSYLNASGEVVSSASVLIMMPWSFKVFYGMLINCVPVWGLRRKSWMLIGWMSDREIKPKDYTPEIWARLNQYAPHQAGKYAMLMFFAACGYVLADACADSLLVELAHREPRKVCATMQKTIYGARTLALVFGKLLVGFSFDSTENGGSGFNVSLNFPALLLIVTICTAPIIPVTWCYIKEEKSPRVSFGEYVQGLWELIQKRAFYQLIFNFFHGLFANISFTANSPVQQFMAGATPLTSILAEVMSNLMFMLGIKITTNWTLGWNWRWVIVLAGLFVLVADAASTFITVWDVFCSRWLWFAPQVAVTILYGVGWMVSNLFIVELASAGDEGIVYSLLATTSNLSGPFAQALTLIVDEPFHLWTTGIQDDDHSIRMGLTYAISIMYATTIFSWVFLAFLPRQKAEVQELLRRGGSSKWLGGMTVFYIALALVWSLSTNISVVLDSTVCGPECDPVHVSSNVTVLE